MSFMPEPYEGFCRSASAVGRNLRRLEGATAVTLADEAFVRDVSANGFPSLRDEGVAGDVPKAPHARRSPRRASGEASPQTREPNHVPTLAGPDPAR